MAELWFYHLERSPLEKVLPELLEKTLARGWRALVQLGSRERIEALDTALWTYREESFLPHGTIAQSDPDAQPVLLTAERDNVNGAHVLVLVEGSHATPLGPERIKAFERCIIIFDGHDPAAVEAARGQWHAARAAAINVAYWQEEAGRWTKKS